MSRDWEGDYYFDTAQEENLAYGRWENHMKHGFKSKRGQKYLKEFIEALEAMPVKELIDGSLAMPTYESIDPWKKPEDTSKEVAGVCAIGAYAIHKGMNPTELLGWDDESVSQSIEIAESFGMTQIMGWAIGECNDSIPNLTPAQRWEFVHEWAKQVLAAGYYIWPQRINIVYST